MKVVRIRKTPEGLRPDGDMVMVRSEDNIVIYAPESAAALVGCEVVVKGKVTEVEDSGVLHYVCPVDSVAVSMEPPEGKDTPSGDGQNESSEDGTGGGSNELTDPLDDTSGTQSTDSSESSATPSEDETDAEA